MPRSGFFSRRSFVRGTSLMTVGGILVPGIGLAQTGGDIVETAGGRVRGVTIDGIKWFRGIPYGADTSGKNRFMPPKKVAAWAGVRDCTNWGHLAPQHINPNPSDYTRYVRWNNYRGGMSEDCLVVNVWTPGIGDNGKRAVMFVIHGGGYTSGSGNLEALEGQHLARLADMVVVTVNHRLGMLGFCDLSAFAAAGLESSGNAGMMDLVLALDWVRDNIAQFGGDPGNVTITGQSGGGGKCSHLMAMPSAKGLFHKVAIQSGSTLKTGRHEERQKDADALCAKLGVQKGDLAKFQAIPFQQIVDNQTGAGPVLDGTIIPRDPFDPDAPAISAHVPMIIGTCLDDTGFTLKDTGTDTGDDDASILAWLRGQLHVAHAEDKAGAVLAAYRKDYPKQNGYMLRAMMLSDHGVRRNAVAQAERKAAQGTAPVYMYRWDWLADGVGAHWGAVHGTDLSPALANATTSMTGNTPQGRLLARQLGSSFAALAKTGNPNNATMPAWAPYSATQRQVMVFGAETHPVNDPSPDLRRLWDQILSA